MPRNQLAQSLNSFLRVLQECRSLASDANHWSTSGAHPHISKARADSITELAFLRACIAFEGFLEEVFILYVMGKKAPRGKAPVRYLVSLPRKIVQELVLPEKNPGYAFWDELTVMRRSNRFFRDGYPFAPAIRAHQSTFQEMRTIRNAVAHGSNDCWDKFKSVVRARLSILPRNLAVGGFLSTTIPASTPPESFIDSYLDIFEASAKQIVQV